MAHVLQHPHDGHDHAIAGHAGHDHAGHGHHHTVSPDADRRLLAMALGLLLAFMAAEVVVAFAAGSLALLSDAAHMLTDAGALALALLAMRLAARPASGALTFGLKRAEILSAQLNGLTLVVLGLVIVFEGVRRLLDPPEVDGAAVVVVALVGVAVNLAATSLIARADRRSLNVEGAYQHLLTDLFAFIATAIAGTIVLTTGFARANGIAALLVAATMLKAGAGLVRASTRVLVEASPVGVDPDEVGRALVAVPGVVEVHDLHVWEVTSGFPSLSAHVVVGPDTDCHAVRRELEMLLVERFGIEHTTLQTDHQGGALLSISSEARRP